MKAKRLFAVILSVALLFPVGSIGLRASAAGTVSGVVGTYSVVSAIPGGTNLLSGITPTKDATTIEWTPSGGTIAQLTDGVLCQDETQRVLFDSCWGPQHYGFTFDLGAVYSLSSFLVCSENGNGQQQYWVKIYVSTNLATLYNDANLVAEAKGMTADEKNIQVFPSAAAEGQYVGIASYSSPEGETDRAGQGYLYYGTIRFGELGAYGTYVREGGKIVNDPLIAGKMPGDIYLSWYKDPGKYINGQTPAWKNLASLTDGDPDTSTGLDNAQCLVYTEPKYQLLNGGDGGFIEPYTPWIVLIYSLGGKARVNTMSLTSTNEPGYHVAGADFYVADSIKDLFKTENRIFTTGGENWVRDEVNDTYILDPEYDRKDRQLSCDIAAAGGKTGRYAAFVINRAFPTDICGYGLARVAELSVTGELLEAETPLEESDFTVTDPATGVAVTLKQLNLDDVDFFRNLKLKVTKSALPASAQTVIDKGWLVVDSDVYTLELTDLTGRALTTDEVGDRYWHVSIPSSAGHFQMLGQVDGNKVTRQRHSFTNTDNTAVVAGTDIENAAMLKGCRFSFVLLRYNDLDTLSEILGHASSAQLSVYSTQGATATAENRLSPWWLLALLPIIPVCVIVLRRNSRKGGEAK